MFDIVLGSSRTDDIKYNEAFLNELRRIADSLEVLAQK